MTLVRFTLQLFFFVLQMQLATTSNNSSCRKNTGHNRLISVKKFVSSVNTLLQRTRDLASSVRMACEDMDLEKLVSLPEEICSSAGNIVRQKRAFIETEYSASVGSNQDILDEIEYLEKKCNDVEVAAEFGQMVKCARSCSARGQNMVSANKQKLPLLNRIGGFLT